MIILVRESFTIQWVIPSLFNIECLFRTLGPASVVEQLAAEKIRHYQETNKRRNNLVTLS